MPSTERRQSTRRGARNPVWLRQTADEVLIACALVDLSAAGACVQVGAEVPLSGQLELLFSPGLPGRACMLVWRQGDRVGLRYATG